MLTQRITEMLEDAINTIFATLQDEEGITSGDIRPEDAFDLDEATAKVAEIIERVLAYEPRKGDC